MFRELELSEEAPIIIKAAANPSGNCNLEELQEFCQQHGRSDLDAISLVKLVDSAVKAGFIRLHPAWRNGRAQFTISATTRGREYAGIS